MKLPDTRGEKHPKSRLTNKQVWEIRRRFDAGETSVSIAKKMGICQTHAHKIGSRKAWRHLPEEKAK